MLGASPMTNHFQLRNAKAARIGKGNKDTPWIRGFRDAIIVWMPRKELRALRETIADACGVMPRRGINQDRGDWRQTRLAHFLVDRDSPFSAGKGSMNYDELEGAADRLSAIPGESSRNASPSARGSQIALLACYLQHVGPGRRRRYRALSRQWGI